jgi:hypothetical protein
VEDIQRHIVGRSRKHSCHGNVKIRYLFIIVGVDAAVNNINVFSVAMEKQELVPLHCCRNTKYKILLTAVNNNNH